GEHLAEAVETTLPRRAAVADPVSRHAESHEVELTGPDASHFLGANETAALEHLEVLRHGGQRNIQRSGELAHRRRPSAQLLDHATARGVADGVKHAIHARGS